MTDRQCPQCNYNLRGLSYEGRCPECGTPITRPASRTTGTMADEAPSHYVRKLQAGFLLAAAGAIGAIFSFSPMITIIATLCWVGGIWLTTLRRPGRGTIIPDRVLDNDRFRYIVRAMNCAWPIYAAVLMGLTLLNRANPNSSSLLTIPLTLLTILTGAIAWCAFIPTSIYFAELSYWASHDNFAQRLRGTAWGMAVFGTLGVVLTAISAMHIGASDAAAFALIFVMILLVISLIAFFITVLQLAFVMGSVMKYQKLAEGSAQRVRERIERDIARPGTISTGLHCEYCGYDLDGLPIGGLCPECGQSFADQTSTVTILDPANMHKDRDESEIELAAGEQQRGIYFNTEIDAYGKPKSSAQAFTGYESDIPDEGDIPLSDGPLATESDDQPIKIVPNSDDSNHQERENI